MDPIPKSRSQPATGGSARADPDAADGADRLYRAAGGDPSAGAAAAGAGELDHRRLRLHPKRYDSSLLNLPIPGGAGAKVWTFVTYSLLHANLTHLGFNVLWLLPFGSALARRFGAVRFFLFLAVTAAAGALAHLVTHEHAVAPMIGASASVSGAMAAAIRFAFVRGSFLSFNRARCRYRGKGSGAAAIAGTARRAGGGLPRGVVRRQHHLRRRRCSGSTTRSRDAWPGRRISAASSPGCLLFSLFDPVPRVRSDAADASSRGHFKPYLKRRLRLWPNSFIIPVKNVASDKPLAAMLRQAPEA